MGEHMLSTVDNPFNPFHQLTEWNAYDVACGYNTLSFLARIVRTSDDLSEADQSSAYEAAIDEITRENVLGLYIKVTADTQVGARVRPAAPRSTTAVPA